jgi:hypothetical protein
MEVPKKKTSPPKQKDPYEADEEFKLNEDEDMDMELDGADDLMADEENPDDEPASKIKHEDVGGEDLAENVFIDNLPKSKTEINIMLRDVNSNIRALE